MTPDSRLPGVSALDGTFWNEYIAYQEQAFMPSRVRRPTQVRTLRPRGQDP